MEKTLGIYIHIPFCASKCGYCDFYSLAGHEHLMPRYQEALKQHLRESAASMSRYYIDSVYFGGGTPSIYGAKRLCELLTELKNTGVLLKRAEITTEANPDSVKLSELKRLRREGFNRISIGAQSANNDILKIIGRRHSWRQVETAVETARAAGFDNISLDLMYGLPSQTRSDWADTLTKALALKPEHISCYALTLEEGTPMYRYKGSPFLPDDDEMADMYLYAVDFLASYGYPQYEVSNFAIPGYESAHNLKYWRLEDYMGFGPGAASCVGEMRYTFIRSLDSYIKGICGHGTVVAEREIVGANEKAAEYVMLGMRTTKGICDADYRKFYRGEFADLETVLKNFAKKGWAEQAEDGSWHFTPSGFLLSNTLIASLLEAQAGSRVELSPWMREAFDAKDKQKLPLSSDEIFEAEYEKIKEQVKQEPLVPRSAYVRDDSASPGKDRK